MTFDDLTRARQLFGIAEQATLADIRTIYHRLVRESHPDLHDGSEDERIRQINAAYRLLREYCDGYTFSFNMEEFLRQNPDERLRMQFTDPLWGGG